MTFGPLGSGVPFGAGEALAGGAPFGESFGAGLGLGLAAALAATA